MQSAGKNEGDSKKYKNNPEKLNQETIELYKREKVSPFSGCLSSIIQIILIISVFLVGKQTFNIHEKGGFKQG